MQASQNCGQARFRVAKRCLMQLKMSTFPLSSLSAFLCRGWRCCRIPLHLFHIMVPIARAKLCAVVYQRSLLPFSGDQQSNAEKIQEADGGIAFAYPSMLTAESCQEALDGVLTNADCATSAAALGSKLQALEHAEWRITLSKQPRMVANYCRM